jgi:hypothetical protein
LKLLDTLQAKEVATIVSYLLVGHISAAIFREKTMSKGVPHVVNALNRFRNHGRDGQDRFNCRELSEQKHFIREEVDEYSEVFGSPTTTVANALVWSREIIIADDVS